MKLLPYLLLILAVAGCSDRAYKMAEMPATSPDANASPVANLAKPEAQADGEARRYIASAHELELTAPAATLHEHFSAIQAECLKLGCEILDSKQFIESPYQPASASMVARVPPKAFNTFLSSTKTHGKLLSHHSASEDKTAEVIDVEARIKNLEALRARITELLAKRTGDLKETLEAERQLTETQSQLDSINGQRRMLAKQTDMVRVTINLVTQTLAAENSFAAPVSEALKDSGLVFMSSLGMLITLVIGGMPWLVLLVVLFYGVRRLRRKLKRRAAARGESN